MAKFVIQRHVRLHEWVAEEKGFFRDEGLDYEFEAQGLAGASLTTSSVKPADAAPVEARSGAFEDMEKGRTCDAFMMGFLVSADADTDDLERYFRALRRAQAELDLEPEPYTRHWLAEMPEDLQHAADVRRFGPGERIVFEPYTREMFDRTRRCMERWQLFDGDRSTYEDAVLT
jgi:hypothetical protein